MDILSLIKQLLDITDTSQDNILNFYITKAQNAIKHYCNMDDLTGLDNQVADLAMFFYKNKDMQGITQVTQGSRSQTNIDGIPQSIKITLPTPKIRMIGNV